MAKNWDDGITHDHPALGRRRYLLGAAGVIAAVLAPRSTDAQAQSEQALDRAQDRAMADFTPPGAIPVAVLLDEGATIIDFAGAWDAFKAATDEKAGFRIFSVAPTKQPIHTMGALALLPEYTFADAPQPRVIVIPGQGGGRDPAKLEWIRKASRAADHVMSVCTGSFILAHTGLLADAVATTHHGAYDLFEKTFPKIRLLRDVPFVVSGRFSSASAGISGIDLALYVIRRYLGSAAAEATADYLGHRSTAWRKP